MTHEAGQSDALRPLLIALSDGAMGEGQWTQLNNLLADDPAAQDRYLDHLIHEAILQREFGEEVQGENSKLETRNSKQDTMLPQFAAGESSSFEFRTSSFFYAAASAAVIALAVTAWFVVLPEPRIPNPEPSTAPSVALLSDAAFARWGESTLPTALGSDLPAGRLELTAGSAQVMFRDGAVVDLTGPCEFEVLDSGRAYLHRGLIHVLVPERARGFTIEAPQAARIIDLGTEFIVHVDAHGQTWAQVTRGVVRMTMADQSHRLVAGQSAVAMRTGGLRLAEPGEHRFVILPPFDAIPLGNLFDDQTDVPLREAIESDVARTAPTDQSLGVWRVQVGELNRPQAIAPGIQLDMTTLGGGPEQAGAPANDAARTMSGYPLHLGPSDHEDRQGVGMHANALISFDLHALRAAAALPADLPLRFAAMGLVNPTARAGGGGSVVLAAIVCDDRGPIAGYVNGAPMPLRQHKGVWSFSGPTPRPLTLTSEPVIFDVPIDRDSAYLVLACVGGDNITADHGAFLDARLKLDPNPDSTTIERE